MFIARRAPALLMFLSLTMAAHAVPVHLRCEAVNNPLGIDVANPHLSWQSDSTERNWMQSAYQIWVSTSSSPALDASAKVWDSGKIASPESVGITYGGPKLEPRTRYYWSVRVWDAKGHRLSASSGSRISSADARSSSTSSFSCRARNSSRSRTRARISRSTASDPTNPRA